MKASATFSIARWLLPLLLAACAGRPEAPSPSVPATAGECFTAVTLAEVTFPRGERPEDYTLVQADRLSAGAARVNDLLKKNLANGVPFPAVYCGRPGVARHGALRSERPVDFRRTRLLVILN
jgi:hypothetical protein